MKAINKFFLAITTLMMMAPVIGSAQINHAKKETVHIYGNCGMCEATIEKSALKKGVAEADWDRNTKMAQVTYDSTKTDLKEILKRIADAGYDNDLFTAPDAAYSKLHGCCQYERKPE